MALTFKQALDSKEELYKARLALLEEYIDGKLTEMIEPGISCYSIPLTKDILGDNVDLRDTKLSMMLSTAYASGWKRAEIVVNEISMAGMKQNFDIKFKLSGPYWVAYESNDVVELYKEAAQTSIK